MDFHILLISIILFKYRHYNAVTAYTVYIFFTKDRLQSHYLIKSYRRLLYIRFVIIFFRLDSTQVFFDTNRRHLERSGGANCNLIIDDPMMTDTGPFHVYFDKKISNETYQVIQLVVIGDDF